MPLGAGFLFFKESQNMQGTGLTIGKVGRAHGLTGAFFVSGRTDPLPKNLKTVRLGATWDGARLVTVVRSGMQSGRPILVIEGCVTREDAEALTGEAIWVDRAALGLKEGEWCFADLIGISVVSADDQVLGAVLTVANHGAGDFVEIEHGEKGRLAMTLAGDFVDWEKSALGRELRLQVNAETFDECWEKPRA